MRIYINIYNWVAVTVNNQYDSFTPGATKKIKDSAVTTIACMSNNVEGAPCVFLLLNIDGKLLSSAANNNPLVGAIIQLLTEPAPPIARLVAITGRIHNIL